MKKYTYAYRKASSRVFKGSYTELIQELSRTGEYLKCMKGNDYCIGKPSAGYIYEVDPDNFGLPCKAVDAKPYIRNFLHKERVTESDYKKLTAKLNNGEVSFDELFKLYGLVGK